MSNVTVALDAGHGGSDPGARYGNRLEKDDALNLTKAVGNILENNGVNVFYVRMDDEYETPFKKATDANNANADLFVSIHRNSSEYPNQYSGVESLVFRDTGTAHQLATNINNELENVGFNNIGIAGRPNLVVLRRTRMPAVLVEAGFINTDADNALFDSQFDEIAQAIADGILTTIYSGATKTDAEAPADYADSDNLNINDDFNRGDNFDRNNNFNRGDNFDTNNDFNRSDDFDRNGDFNSGNDSDRNNSGNQNDNSGENDNLNRNSSFNQSSDFDRNNNFNPVNDFNRDNSFNQDNDFDRNNNFSRNRDFDRNNNFNQDNSNYMQRSNEMSDDKLYRVQVGAYRNKENADRLLNSLLVEGFPAFMIQEDGYYKVQVGAFQVLTNAIKMELRLRRFRYNTYIVYD